MNVIQLILGLDFHSFLSITWQQRSFRSLLCVVHRLHDTDRSGAWALLYIGTIIGWLVLFVFACLEGNLAAMVTEQS
ncbi:DUF805 domain-containing protein [Escherichia coli]